MKKVISIIILPLIILILNSCSKMTVVYKPFGLDEVILSRSEKNKKINNDIIESMFQQIETKSNHKIHSVLIAKDGDLLFEKYYNKSNQNSPHDIRSATKSITSILIGIAIDKGYIESLSDPIMDYLNKDYPEIKNKITIKDLITMNSGLDCNDRDWLSHGQEDKMYLSKDWVKYFLSLSKRAKTPKYCTGGVVTLGKIIENASNKSIDEFSKEYLFDPLGIKNFQWSKFLENKGTDTGGHLLITSQGLLKIGLLINQNGKWKNKQIVSESWISESTSKQLSLDNNDYGYLWWINKTNYGSGEIKTITARGNGGQTIFIVPKYNLVTVMTTAYYNSDNSKIPFELFFKTILPSVNGVINQ